MIVILIFLEHRKAKTNYNSSNWRHLLESRRDQIQKKWGFHWYCRKR